MRSLNQCVVPNKKKKNEQRWGVIVKENMNRRRIKQFDDVRHHNILARV